ncbi:MAG: hypothetical protein ACREBX_13345 [Sphingopyxis sp.]
MFRILRGTEPIATEAFLDWDERDRLGVVVDEQVGALGAGLLLLFGAAAFYDAGAKRRRRTIYPEIYIFHAGGPWGSFLAFDLYPTHKEVFVEPTCEALLAAINSRGITHLAVPERTASSDAGPAYELEAAVDRLKQCFAYGSDGTLSNASITISTENMALLGNYSVTLDIGIFDDAMARAGQSIPLQLRPSASPALLEEIGAIRRRAEAEARPDEPSHISSRRRLEAAIAVGRIEEQLREISAAEAIAMLGSAQASAGIPTNTA